MSLQDGPDPSREATCSRLVAYLADLLGVPESGAGIVETVQGLMAEVEQLRRKQPEPCCLLCSRSEPCGLHAPGLDGQPDPSATLVCMFDDTYTELIERLHRERRKWDAEVERLKADAELLNWLDSRPRYSIIRNVWRDGSNDVAISGLLDLGGARDDELYGPDVRSALRSAMEAARRE